VTTKMLGIGGDFCTSVSCGGVAVNPGDAVLADENGVLVLPVQDIEYAAKRAIQMSLDEKLTLARIDQGEKYPDILGSSKIIADVLANRFK